MATMGMLGDDDKRMTFTEHLGELRVRLIRVVVGLAVAFCVSFALSEYLFEIMRYPLLAANVKWITNKPMEPMTVPMKLATYGALVFCLPHIMYELCAFVFPGLKPKEKKVALILILGCGVLALSGAGVAYFLVSPQLITMMVQWNPPDVEQQLLMSDTIDFEFLLLLAFAFAFQFPMVVLICVYLGLVTPQMLKKYRSIAAVLLCIAAAALTPTADPINLLTMWIPLVLMYEACIWISYLIARRQSVA
ncbi:MAG: twin-arginine translocase subunit TatC [Candidatus Hydrogenedentes bacterium]|nr:twin-arginine translocase subunit TatC [Candidatus Hydrogenedentota bacterium]